MKKLFLFIAFVCCSANAMAQSEVGKLSIKPMAGVNLSNFTNATADVYHMKVGMTGGAELECGVNPWLGLSLGLMYSEQGAKIDGTVDGLFTDENGDRWATHSKMDGKLKCSYLNLPLMAHVYIPSLKGLSIEAGVQVGLVTSDRMTMEVLTSMWNLDYFIQSSVRADINPVRATGYIADMSDVTKSVDFGIPLGLSYEYKNIVLDARYYFGLTKIDKTENPDNARNQYLSITLGYKFHLK